MAQMSSDGGEREPLQSIGSDEGDDQAASRASATHGAG